MKHGNSQTGKIPIFRERLRQLQGNLTTTDFASQLDLSRQTVGFYLNGDRIPDAQTLIQIAKKCNVSADYLLGLTDTMTTDTNVRTVAQFTGFSELAIDRIKTLEELSSEQKEYVEVLSWFLEEPYSLGFFMKLQKYLWASLEFRSVKDKQKLEYDQLYSQTLGDVKKEIELRESGEYSFTLTPLQVDEIEDQKDIALIRMQREFDFIIKKLDQRYCDTYKETDE